MCTLNFMFHEKSAVLAHWYFLAAYPIDQIDDLECHVIELMKWLRKAAQDPTLSFKHPCEECPSYLLGAPVQ